MYRFMMNLLNFMTELDIKLKRKRAIQRLKLSVDKNIIQANLSRKDGSLDKKIYEMMTVYSYLNGNYRKVLTHREYINVIRDRLREYGIYVDNMR